MKRRQFTTSVAALAGLSATSGATAAAVRQIAGKGSDIELMARQRFEQRLGQQFTVRGKIDTQLHLSAVETAVKGRGKEQFHVQFNAPHGQTLPEGIYFLQRGGKTEFGLHLIPGDTVAGRQRLIATINLQHAS